MATKGKISELYDVARIQEQQARVIELIDEYVRKVKEGDTAKIGLQSATKPSEIISGLNQVITAQKEQAKTANDAVIATNNLGKAMQSNTNIVNDAVAARTRLLNSIEKFKAIQAEDNKLFREGIITKAEYIQRTNETNTSIARLQARLKDANKDISTLTKTERQQASERALNARIEQDANNRQIAILQKSINQIRSQTGAYKQLENEYKEVSLAAKNFNVTLGANNPLTIAATRNAAALNERLKEIDASVGQTNRNVGNYADGVAKGVRRIFSVVRNLAYILPGIGIAGIFAVLGDSIGNFFAAFGRSETVIEKANKRLKEFISSAQELKDEATAGTAGELSQVKALVAVIEDQTKSYKLRNAALNELKDINKSYFGDLDLESDKMGVLRERVNEYTKAIIAAAVVKGFTDEITKISVEQSKQITQYNKLGEAADKATHELEDFKKANPFVEQGSRSETGDGGTDKLIKLQENVRKTKKVLSEQGYVVSGLAAQYKLLEDNINAAVLDQIKLKPLDDPKKDRVKAEKDNNKEIFKSDEELRKALFDIEARKLQDKIDASAAVIADDKKTFAERILAANDFYDASIKLIDLQKQYELDDLGKKEEEENRVANKEIKNAADRQKVLDGIKKTYDAKRLLVQVNANSAVLKLDTDSEKQRTELIKKETERREKEREELEKEAVRHNTSVHESEMQDIKNRYDEEILALDRKFKKGRIKEEEYNKRRLKLQLGLQVDLLEEDIKFTKETIALAEARAAASGKQADMDAIVEAKKKLHALEIQLEKAVFEYGTNDDDEDFKKFVDKLTKIKDYAKELLDIVGGFVKAATDKQLNSIQEQIDALEEKKQKDIEVANASVGTAQDRAAAIAIIESRAAAQKEALERKQRKLKEENARFEKAATIASLIMETALAVIRALGSKPYTPANIGLAIATGAIGAAQIAVAIAQPIPHYEKGGRHRKGGPAVVGEKRAELLDIPGKGMFVVKEPTLFEDLPQDTVIHPNAEQALRDQMRTTMGLMGRKEPQQIQNGADMGDVLEGLSAIEKAIKKMPLPEITVENVISKRVRRGDSTNTYLNRNLQ